MVNSDSPHTDGFVGSFFGAIKKVFLFFLFFVFLFLFFAQINRNDLLGRNGEKKETFQTLVTQHFLSFFFLTVDDNAGVLAVRTQGAVHPKIWSMDTSGAVGGDINLNLIGSDRLSV